MDAAAKFELASLALELLPILTTLLLATLPFPRAIAIRFALAVIAAWAASVFYVVGIYNPAGIEAARALGEHFPEGRYDNNTTASMLLGGWMMPTACVATLSIARYIARRMPKDNAQRRPTENK
jgi:hypothetical protein